MEVQKDSIESHSSDEDYQFDVGEHEGAKIVERAQFFGDEFEHTSEEEEEEGCVSDFVDSLEQYLNQNINNNPMDHLQSEFTRASSSAHQEEVGESDRSEESIMNDLDQIQNQLSFESSSEDEGENYYSTASVFNSAEERAAFLERVDRENESHSEDENVRSLNESGRRRGVTYGGDDAARSSHISTSYPPRTLNHSNSFRNIENGGDQDANANNNSERRNSSKNRVTVVFRERPKIAPSAQEVILPPRETRLVIGSLRGTLREEYEGVQEEEVEDKDKRLSVQQGMQPTEEQFQTLRGTRRNKNPEEITQGETPAVTESQTSDAVIKVRAPNTPEFSTNRKSEMAPKTIVLKDTIVRYPPTMRESLDGDRWVVDLPEDGERVDIDPEPVACIPEMWSAPELKGWMVKQGHFVKNWKERWFILQHNSLFYFKTIPTKYTKEPLGWIYLRGAEIHQVSFKPFTLHIWEPRLEKVYYVTYSSMVECKEWEEALKRAAFKRSSEVNNVKKGFESLSPDVMANISRCVSTTDPNKVFNNFVRISKGGGNSNGIYSAVEIKTQQAVAVKTVEVTANNLKFLLPEISYHKSLEHPNIVKFLDCYFLPEKKQIWIVLERMETSLKTVIQKSMKNYDAKFVGQGGPVKLFSESLIAFVTHRVLRALSTLHYQNKIHRNVKSSNILLSNEWSEVKLSDFGCVAQLDERSNSRGTVVGTPHYMAPEMIMEFPYDKSIDIWALGITIVEMAEGSPPYSELSPAKAVAAVVDKDFRGLRHSGWSDNLRDLLSKMLVRDPKKRSTADQLLFHPFFDARLEIERVTVQYQ
eukprot:TRINITY_DN3107_c0_g1_i1.p1 TRINITY_DN3107_c0_g1~~TRINITY_DN3107_c0_g1_i1.p1  ORF type:complete len:816 (+),score=234.83 TRINITY_DN3107_c0_g1_i1:48-2495(+)